jgi:predicted nucleotidyltransferase
MLKHDEIVHALADTLEPLDFVHSFWEGGAAATGRLDEWSDIDLYVVADENRMNDTFEAVEKALEKLSPIAQKFEAQQLPWPGVQQAFYRLAKASKYLLIDLAVLKPDAPETFLAPEIHGEAVFYFNKDNRVKTLRLDREAHVKKIRARLERLKARFSMFNVFVQKEINRGNTIEALDLYHAFTFGSLVEALRIKHTPFHYDFRTRYVHHELPKNLVEKLEQLTFVRDAKELQAKYDEATRLFHETVQSIDMDETGRLVKHSR